MTKVTDLANDPDIDVEGMATSASKLYEKVKQLTAVKSNDFNGISILTDAGAYKSTYQILSEISDVWKEITDVNQAALLEELAGKRQAAAIAAIMNDPQLLKEGLKYAENAAGATDEAMEIAMDSMQARLDQLKNNWQAFWQDLIDSDSAKQVISFVNTLVGALDKLIKIGDKLGGSMAPLLGLMSGVGVGFHQIRTQDPTFGPTALLSSLRSGISSFSRGAAKTDIANITKKVFESGEFEDAVGAQEKLKTSLMSTAQQYRISEKDLDGYIDKVIVSKDNVDGLADELTKTSSGFRKFGLGLANTLGTMLAVTAAMAALNFVIKTVDENIVHRYENNIKKAKEFVDAQKEIAKSVETNLKTIDGYKERFDTLSQGVDEYGNNVSLTTKEFEEYKSIIAQIVEISPQVAKGYDLENGYLVNKIDLLEQAKKAQEEEYKASLIARTNADDGAKTELNAALATYKLAQQEYSKNSHATRYNGVEYGNTFSEQWLLNENMSNNQYAGIAALFGGEAPEYEVIDKTVSSRLNELYMASKEYSDAKKDLAHYLSEDVFHLALDDNYDYSQFFTDYEDQINATAVQTARSLHAVNADATDSFEGLREEVNVSVDSLNTYQKSYDEAARSIRSNLGAVAELTANYGALGNEYKSLVSAFISGFGPEDLDNGYGELDREKYHKVSAQINDLVNALFMDTGLQELIKSLQSDSIKASDYSVAVDNIIAQVQSAMPDGIELSADQIKANLNLVPVDSKTGLELTPAQMKEIIESHMEGGGSIDLGTISMGKLTAMYDAVVELQNESSDGSSKYSQEFIENIAEYTRQKKRIENISHSTFEAAKTSVEEYTAALSTLPKFISNNVTITEDQYKEIIKVVGAEKELNNIISMSEETIDGNTAYVVKNSEALNKLLQSNTRVSDAMRKVADGQDQAKKRYAELTSEIYKTITATEGFDQAALNSLYAEAEAIQDLIDDYAILEQQVLGNTKAFDDFAKAKEKDTSNTTYASSIVEMYNTIKDAQKTGKVGTEAFQVAARSLLPEGWNKDLNDFVSVTEESFAHVDKLISDGLLTVKDGVIQEIDQNNVIKFVEKALESDALDGDVDNFVVLADSVEDFAQKMGMAKEDVIAFLEAESQFDIYGRNILEELSGNNLSKQIHSANQELMTAMTELNEAYLSGDQALIEAANKNVEEQKEVVDGLAEQATQVTTRLAPYINDQAKLQNEINEAMVAVQNTQEGTYANEKAKSDLAYLIDTYRMLQQPIQLEVSIAKDNLESQIADLDKQIEQVQKIQDPSHRDAELAPLMKQRDELQSTLDEINTFVGEDQEELAKVFDVDSIAATDKSVQNILEYVNEIGENKSIYNNGELNETLTLLGKIANSPTINTAGVEDVKKAQADALEETKRTIARQQEQNESNRRMAARKAYEDKNKVIKDPVEELREGLKYSRAGDPVKSLYEESSLNNKKSLEEIIAEGKAAEEANRKAEEASKKRQLALKQELRAERASRRTAPEVPAVDLPEPEVQVTVDTEYASEDLEMLMSMLQNEQETIDLVVSTEYGGMSGLDEEQLQFIKDISDAQDNIITISTDGDADVKVTDIADKLEKVRQNAVTNLQFPENGDVITKLDNIIFKLRTIKKLGADNASVSASADGTANAFGNSYAGGKKNDLVGELGREMVVDPHTGRYYTVGENGAEFINLPKDAIVFNHIQTEDLLKHGHTTRGKSFVTGNAYAWKKNEPVGDSGAGSRGGVRQTSASIPSSAAVKAAAEEAAKDWVEAFKKAQQELEKQYKAGEISFEEYLDGMTALYQKYYDQYGSKSKEEMEKLHNAWVEMYNGTQSLLDSQYGDGEISLKQYLNSLQSLYQRFYANTTEYAKERAEAEKNYIKQMKSGYESLFSAANTVIQHQINDLERQKKAADKAYDAQIRAIQSQIDHYEDLIEGIEKQKKAIQKEIDAIQKSNEERQRAIDLQKAQYELARAQNQRTQYIYTSDKGFVYRSNPTEEREKREELDNQKTEQRIAELQAEIDKLDETIEKYQEQIDIWNKQIEAIEKMKEATDRYFDDLIEQLQLQQEKWSEFQEMMELAQAISVLESFGLTVQDVLNGTGEGMDRIKEGFLSVLATINKGNEEGLVGLSQAFGKSVEEVQGMITDADSMAIGVGNLITSLVQNAAGAAEPVDAVADSMSKLTGSTKDTAGLKDVADTMSKISGTDATGLTDSLTTLSQNAGQFTALNQELTQLLDTINNLGQNTTFASNGELLAQFQAFCQNFMLQAQTFKDNVTALFGGGVAAGAGAEGGGAGGASGGWFDSFVAQVEDLNMRTQGPMAELTAQWQTLKDTIQSIIGSYDEEGGGEEDDSSILGNFAIGSEGLLLALQEWTDSLLNFQSEGIAPVASSITDIINSMADAVIAACSRAAAAINALRGQAVEANIAVTGGGVADGTAHALGTAFVNGSGNWGLRNNERGALVGELGPEAVVIFFIATLYGDIHVKFI